MRPLTKDRVWVFDTIYSAGEIPNFICALANKYKISKKDATDYPNRFLKHSIGARSAAIDNLKENITKFEDLTHTGLQ